MRWRSTRQSTNIEDRRGMGMRPVAIGGGLGTLLLLLLMLLLGRGPGDVPQAAPGAEPGALPAPAAVPEDEMGQFVAAVLGDTEDTWEALFDRKGRDYEEPVLVLYSGIVQSACGFAQAAVGPFYCPIDSKLYIDLTFYDDLRERLGAPGDFAQAYVIAHEVGHHVQTQLGVTQQVQELRGRLSPEESNELSVRVELQADCYAGVWAHHAGVRQILEAGDIEEAMNAAAAIGDDRLQQEAQGYIVPDSFTHGTSEQRTRWFRRGFESGDMDACDTFNPTEV
jgi:predicted metalloprotease